MSCSQHHLVRLLLVFLLCLPLMATASGLTIKFDQAPMNNNDIDFLQCGAGVFVDERLNYSSAAYTRYTRLTELGPVEAQVRYNRLFASENLGDTMTIARHAREGENWFGATPTDNDSRPSGWHLILGKVNTPHVLCELQGYRVTVMREVTGKDGKAQLVIESLPLVKPGYITLAEYDARIGGLINYMTCMGEPSQAQRRCTRVSVFCFCPSPNFKRYSGATYTIDRRLRS